ncbi:MAG: RNA-binding S4 domain-containing protein [Candidatus Zixiibacteriota bacterium]|nr:MAG: RNA-binding S4 domain-containing protein [candidate division Zixibacteria bacterium]
MRIDDFLSTVGVIKRRTVAKELAQKGMIAVNGRTIKPACQVRVNDIIAIKGNRAVTVEVLALPTGSVPKDQREVYLKELTRNQ